MPEDDYLRWHSQVFKCAKIKQQTSAYSFPIILCFSVAQMSVPSRRRGGRFPVNTPTPHPLQHIAISSEKLKTTNVQPESSVLNCRVKH